MKPSPERLARVERLKDTLRLPMTEADKVAHRCAQAAEDAKANARRQPAPQLPLEVAA